MGLDFYISYEIGNIDKLDRSLHTQWSETIRILRKAEHYISQVSKSSIVSITTPSGRIEWQHVTRPVQESLDHAIAVSIDEKKLSELRGVKPSGAAVLTLELFDSLEWCFKRKIARNFDISRGKKKSETYIKEFLNPDVILIYVLVNVVENGVSVGHIRQALSRMPTAHQ